MLSESARATAASESRYRICAPKSPPRVVTVIALDAVSEALVKGLDRSRWPGASFCTASAFESRPASTPVFSMAHWLSDLAGRTKDLIAEVARADLVVMIAAAGTGAEAAVLIGEACQLHRVMTTALVLGAAGTAEDGAARTSARLRPYSNMLVAAGGPDHVADLLTALRA